MAKKAPELNWHRGREKRSPRFWAAGRRGVYGVVDSGGGLLYLNVMSYFDLRRMAQHAIKTADEGKALAQAIDAEGPRFGPNARLGASLRRHAEAAS